MNKDNKKEGKFANFIYINKKKIGAVITSAALVVGLGIGMSQIKFGSEDNTDTKPNNTIENIIKDPNSELSNPTPTPANTIEESQNKDNNELVGPVLIKDNQKTIGNIHYTRSAENHRQKKELNNNSNSNSNRNNQNNNENNSNNNGNNNQNNPDNIKKPHKHQFGPWKALDDDYETRTCLIDGTTQTRKHQSYGIYFYNPKTGLEESTCSDCGHIKTRTHEKHTWRAYKDNGENEIASCLWCNETKTRNHTFTDWHIAPYNENLEIRECKTCDHGEARNHTYGEYIYNPSTGKEEATCETCGHVTSKEHTHTWSEYTNNGENEISQCEVCDEVRTKDHEYGEWTALNDEQEIRYCSNDNATETRSHTYGAYTYNSRTGREESTCQTCGHTKSRAHSQVHSHTWSPYTNNGENEISSCYGCGQTRTRSHTYGAYTYNESTHEIEAKCETCSHVKTETHTHDFTNWEYLDNELEQGECLIDGTTTTKSHTPNEYTYNSSTKKEETTCQTCGKTITRQHTHTNGHFVNNETNGNEDEICPVCHEVIGHQNHTMPDTWTEVEGDPTHETRKCETCEYTETKEKESAHVHTLGEEKQKRVKRNYDDSSHSLITYQVCETCGEEVVKSDVAEAHTFDPTKRKITVIIAGSRWLITDTCTVETCKYNKRTYVTTDPNPTPTPNSNNLSTQSTSTTITNTEAYIKDEDEDKTLEPKGKQKTLKK